MNAFLKKTSSSGRGMRTLKRRARAQKKWVKTQRRVQRGGAGDVGDACAPTRFGDSCDWGVLCYKGVCVPKYTSYRQYYFMSMIMRRNVKAVARFLELDPTLLNRTLNYDSHNMTPLMLAAYRNENVAMVHYLLEAGAEISAKTDRNVTALWFASQEGHAGNVGELMVWKDAGLDTPNVDLVTPLMIAAINDRAGVVEVLLGAGANPALGDVEKRTALMLACKNGAWNSTNVLLRKAPDTLNLQDIYGHTALMHAIGHYNVFHLLLTAGADTTLTTRKGETLRSFAEGKSPLAVELLMAASAKEREAILARTPKKLYGAAASKPGSYLGEGSFGSVLAVEKNGRPYAVKRIKFGEYYEKGNYNTEVRSLERVKSSPYTLHIVDSETNKDNAYLLTERLVGKDVGTAWKMGKINDSNIREVVIQSLKGLESIHDLGLLHLDIKPDNLWFTPSPLQIKYIDFGLACPMPCTKKLRLGASHYQKDAKFKKDKNGNLKYEFDRSDDFYALAQIFDDIKKENSLSEENNKWLQYVIKTLRGLPGEPNGMIKRLLIILP